jgi:putative SOS response-associated peptidase YedK
MCERYTFTTSDRPLYNIARGHHAPVALADRPDHMRWGLLAPWRGHGGKRGPMIYEAPLADIAATPLLRNARKKQRCLVLADGFYAWRQLAKKRQPYWIHPAQPRTIAFAGLWATHGDDGRASFAIITVPANELVAPISATMPALADAAWLADGTLAEPANYNDWRADAVSTWVNDVAHQDPRCIAPLVNPAQGELF